MLPFAYGTFLWFTTQFIGLRVVTPDLAVAGIVFLAAGLACRISLAQTRWSHHIALGAALACGYYLKSPMFPLGLALLSLLFVFPPPERHARSKLLCSLATFLLLSAPLIALLSLRAGKPTFGESARLNYGWWAGSIGFPGKRQFALPTDHPAPKLLTAPVVVLEFASSPVPGTYPLWYDPAYWYAGVSARFDFRRQITALRQTLVSYMAMALDSVAFISGLAALCLFALADGRRPVLPRSLWWLLAWPLAALGMYTLVHVEPRYVGSFLILLFLPLYYTFARALDRRVVIAVLATVLGTVMPVFSFQLAKGIADITRELNPPEYQVAARALTQLGLQPGDHVAVVGYAYDCYYARCARMRVVAQIPDSEQFWQLTEPEVKMVAERLASIGVRALVAWNRPACVRFPGWEDFDVSSSARMSVLLLRRE